MTDPYKILGVRRNATAKTIRSAYHKKARQSHPDTNPGDEGAASRFDAVRKAYELLSDPVRRQRYDETGDSSEPRPVNGSGFDFIDIIARALDDTLRASHQSGNTDKVNIVEAVKGRVSEVRRKVEADLGDLKKSLGVVKKAMGRVTTAEGQTNLLEEILRRKCADHEPLIAAASGELDRLTRALNYLKECKCDGTAPSPDSFAIGGWSTFKMSW